ncbi:K02A2.6-like [Cordylochernes scorpioides]|uniref:RNA-directed DNA polymerase n=1 Tax=Cordylochernes scorpioides TaxID=51811 RepID=A0ABY6K7W2_9ARAC|nr:K02A2.6-like [Cordylochernes scorpioides]
MPRRKIRAHYEHMSEFETGRAIGLKEAGWSNRLIARHLCRSDAAIRRCWQKWVNNGSMQRQDGSGRPRATTEREDRAIVRTAVAEPEFTRLRERNLRARRPLRCLPLTPVHRQVRLQWCRERSTWNCADWGRIVFSDESRFLLCPDDRLKRVWIRPGQRVDPGLTVEHHTGPQQGVMVWGAISFDSRTPLVVIPGTLTTQRRLQPSRNVDYLVRQLETIWQEIPQHTIRNLYQSMTRRVAACIQAKEVLKCQAPSDKIMVSFDVKSLYPSLPHQLILSSTEEFLKEIPIDLITVGKISKLIALCLEANIITYNYKTYKQTKGSPMGSSLSTSVAETVMRRIDSNMAENAIRPPKQICLNELNKEGWESWLESFEWYGIATQLSSKAPEVQVAIFMAAMGREAQNIFKSFNLNNADKNNLSIVKDKFNNYFSPKLNTTIERFKFNQMKQKEDESFNEFLTRIKLQIANCKYAVMSDELLKDRIVVGIINNEIRERLLSEADLNLEKATQICIACENATNQMKHVLSDSDKQVAVTKMNKNCRNCGRSHKINQCPAYQKRCNKCKKLNHFANLCRSQNTNSYKVRQIVGSPEPEMIQEFVIQSVENTNLTEDWYEEVKIKGKKVNMKLDTGAQCNVLPLSLAGRLNLEIQRSPVKCLISFSGHRIPVEGQSLAMCMVKNMTAYIRFIISRDNTCPIQGRQTCSNLGLVKRVNTCQAITQEYQELFQGIGCLKGYEYEAKFQTSDMNMQVRPPRTIPLSIKERVKKELEEMEDNGIIMKVNYPTPISSQMVIAKQKGKIRICIDRSDINKIAVNLHGSKYFTKLDLKKGYWQIKVAPNSQRYFTFSTPWGRYMFLRVPFGIKTAPEIFQKITADLLQDLEGTENSMDDILIHAPDPQTLEIRTRAVLQRLKKNGIKLNRDKCKFQLQEVQFLGHIVTTEGIKIDPEKVRAIGEIKSPSNKQELQRLLGMVQYLSRFIPNLAEKTKNMRLLLKKDTPWLWDESLDRDLLEIKTLLRTAPTLKFFNPNGNLTLSVDASSYALGAVLLQNGKPIAYASSALNSTQQNYAQIEKEALAIKFGCDKFHQLIYGKTVDVETDHRPLETIFKKPLSKAPPRLQRIFLQIQQYDLRIKYKKGKELLTADLLSRDCSYEDTYLEENFEVLMTTPTNKSSYEQLQALTKEDQELQELKNLILYGWPNYKSAVPESCKKYWPYRDELSTNEDLIFKGSRVFIPLRDELSTNEDLIFKGSRVFIPLRWKAKILKLIHEGHQGTNSCLRRARDSIYWHGMSQDIINTVENCRTCQANQRNKTKEPMIIKEIPSLPWEIVAADIFSIKGKNYLLITDNYSGFIDFKEMKTMNSAETIESLKKWFSVHGIPRLLETDNVPNFTSRDFKDFQKKWLFDHQTSSPLYPKSNGLAERAVQTAKNLIRKCLDSGQEVELAPLNFYNTPRDGLLSPAQCLFSRRTRTLLPTSTHQLEPEIQKGHTQNLRNKREKQKTHHDKTAKTTRSFKEGEKIMLKQHHREWIPARVTQEVAPRSYKVKTPTGDYRRNSSFMRHTNLESPKQQRRRIPEIPKSTLPEGPGPSGDKEQAQVPEELNTSPRAFSGQEPRGDHQNAEHKNGTLPITTRRNKAKAPKKITFSNKIEMRFYKPKEQAQMITTGPSKTFFEDVLSFAASVVLKLETCRRQQEKAVQELQEKGAADANNVALKSRPPTSSCSLPIFSERSKAVGHSKYHLGKCLNTIRPKDVNGLSRPHVGTRVLLRQAWEGACLGEGWTVAHSSHITTSRLTFTCQNGADLNDLSEDLAVKLCHADKFLETFASCDL